jgi:signal peptidase I
VHYADYQSAISRGLTPRLQGPPAELLGRHWVGDLAVECVAIVESDAGEVLLDLVKGGVHYQCRLNVADGLATLSIDGDFQSFQDENGAAAKHPTATTRLKGKGKYRLRLANVDDQLFLWVNESPVPFDAPTTYGAPTFKDPENVKPVWSEEDPGDFAPVGIGSKGAAVKIARLRVLRDVYYIADNYKSAGANRDYSDLVPQDGYEFHRVFTDPTTWSTSRLFDERRYVEFPYEDDPESYLGPTQFFPCGDNSPASKDGRLWSNWNGDDPPPYVERDLLIGKALLIYWPHTWNRPVPYITPNFERMRLIR